MSHLCPNCVHTWRDCQCGSPDNRDMPCGACGKTHEPRPCPLPAEPKPAPVAETIATQAAFQRQAAEAASHEPAPVVAGEGLFAVLTEDSGDAHFQDINDGSDGFPRDAQRSIGSREMAIAFVGRWPGNKLVRILADGEHEAAVEAAVRAERERVLGLVAAERERVRGKTSDGYLYALDWFEEAAKGQAK
ncbi:hypothetical protein K0U83_16935 [bacterium]|nr:hypothetical protein [bacterium]